MDQTVLDAWVHSGVCDGGFGCCSIGAVEGLADRGGRQRAALADERAIVGRKGGVVGVDPTGILHARGRAPPAPCIHVRYEVGDIVRSSPTRVRCGVLEKV